MDDFCALVQSKDEKVLLHVTCALLHSIHKVFPPPAMDDQGKDDSISIKNYSREKYYGLRARSFWDGGSMGQNDALNYPKENLKISKMVLNRFYGGKEYCFDITKNCLGKCVTHLLGYLAAKGSLHH